MSYIYFENVIEAKIESTGLMLIYYLFLIFFSEDTVSNCKLCLKVSSNIYNNQKLDADGTLGVYFSLFSMISTSVRKTGKIE